MQGRVYESCRIDFTSAVGRGMLFRVKVLENAATLD